MKLHALPRQSRRALALGLLAAASASAAATLWLLLSVFVFDLDAKARAVETRVTSVNSVAGSVSQLRAAWARLERDPRLSIDMFPPASDAQASAAVQSATQKLFARSGATVRSVQTLDVVQEGPVRRVGVRVAVTGTSNQINRALEAVSASRPVLMVSTGNIQLMGESRRPTDSPTAPQLQATFNIFAYARNG
jgi:Type II secretion system (T2SS), protein M subtype b